MEKGNNRVWSPGQTWGSGDREEGACPGTGKVDMQSESEYIYTRTLGANPGYGVVQYPAWMP